MHYIKEKKLECSCKIMGMAACTVYSPLLRIKKKNSHATDKSTQKQKHLWNMHKTLLEFFTMW